MQRTVGLWVQANGGSDHLKEGEGLFFFNFFFFVCDFYQNTEIRHTHKPALKRSSIYSSAGTCPPGQLPAGGMGGGQQCQQREEMKTGGGGAGAEKLGRGQWTWSTNEVTVPKGQKMEDPSSPSSLPKGPQNIAENGEK